MKIGVEILHIGQGIQEDHSDTVKIFSKGVRMFCNFIFGKFKFLRHKVRISFCQTLNPCSWLGCIQNVSTTPGLLIITKDMVKIKTDNQNSNIQRPSGGRLG